MIPLVDGDILVYKAGFAAQKKRYIVELDEGISYEYPQYTTRKTIESELSKRKLNNITVVSSFDVDPIEYAYRSIDLLMESLLKKFDTKQYKLFLTSEGQSNFRFNVDPNYKVNRLKSECCEKQVVQKLSGYLCPKCNKLCQLAETKPRHYKALREYLIKTWKAEVVVGEEADDALGKAQVDLSTVICSIDKDLDMIPGWHFNFDKWSLYRTSDPGQLKLTVPHLDGQTKTTISGGGIKWFFAQLLLGDNADNIQGVRGYGPVKVEKVLREADKFTEMLDIVQKIYYTAYKEQAEKLFNQRASLLWIRRNTFTNWSDYEVHI